MMTPRPKHLTPTQQLLSHAAYLDYLAGCAVRWAMLGQDDEAARVSAMRDRLVKQCDVCAAAAPRAGI